MEAMGANDGLPVAALIATLIARPHSFDLFQAISLLERAVPGAQPLGHGNGAGEAVRLSGFVTMAFQGADVRSVQARSAAADGEADAEARAYTLSTPAFTLAGANGPLPIAYTEMLLASRAARDHAMADLLDIFNHRFLSFLHRGRRKHAPGLHVEAPRTSASSICLDALSNLGLRSGTRGPHGAQLWTRHAGVLGGAPRSMAGLLMMLSERLGLKARGVQFTGAWRELDEADTARLTGRGMHAPTRLGGMHAVGRRTWDQAAGIQIQFDDLPVARIAGLLPGGRDHELAAWLVHRYVQQDIDVQIVLNVKRDASSPHGAAVGGGKGTAARLGWTSWLAGARRPEPVRFALRVASPAAAPAARAATRQTS
ncbi:type VI secretion system baseplate subunit TssG [Paraburkholderia saeva]|uniref:type VI secretion system baseplate subunit TssG n=1 Tax=Paraburkholderia saeva TaxID=2777537 RepID=UPI001D8CFC07|nr:type VI secretion system baseplate subunit TssG [Paraburkholderia saeva]CAG4890056.1 hypothetical protein R70241_00899 [Paraburkholderia saeva]CAG4897746.1 hypothetical protein R52603_02351 [Paraburkholderia saeva]